MAAIKSESNHAETLEIDGTSFEDRVLAKLDHLDAMVHALEQRVAGVQGFVEDHRPALERGLGMLDPGAKLRGLVTGKKKG